MYCKPKFLGGINTTLYIYIIYLYYKHALFLSCSRDSTEQARARRQPLYMCFVDFEKAFDRVSHKKLWKVMTDMGFARHSRSDQVSV